MDGFVHLHVHSEYSLLDGANRIGDLAGRAKAMGQSAIAISDHGNLFGAMEFYKECSAAGVQPILGMEAYISPTTRFDRSMGSISLAAYHLLLLSMNATGWRNLVKLSSRAYLEGFYYRPRIDRELLGQFNEGLICTTACLGGEVPSALLSGQMDSAERIAREYLEIFGKDRFFIEIQCQGIPDQDKVNPLLVELAGKLGVGIVGTNDVHFLTREDKASHEVLTAISTGKTLSSGGGMTYSPELYLKSSQEMRQAFAAWPEAADNTLKIAERCKWKLPKPGKHLPVFNAPDGQGASAYLTKVAFEALNSRFAGSPPPEYVQRLQRELDVIDGKGYCGYLLIVHDFVQFAKRSGIPIGARGSGCATLLGYVLDICCCDPIRYGLLFERWTDPQRDEDPDFDIDICQEGRAKVLDYVRNKYGHVAQIITYGTLKARAVVRDVGRVLDMPLVEVDAICKKIPESPTMTLDKALESEPSLREMLERDGRVADLFKHARTLEGLARHSGVHAAGVIVAQEPLENLVPLCRQADSEDAITQWDGPTCEKAGLMKMDFLGLRTLTVIQRARELAAARIGRDVDPERIAMDDQAVYELFRKGETVGVFQFESTGMRNILMQMKPTCIEDLIAANAMYRPGPMELIPAYCNRKHGTEAVPSIHGLVDDILKETYGIMAYQEQVMQVLNRLGKLPLNRALTLIKAIGKKKEKDIAAERPNFLVGAQENGISGAEAERLFDLILKFAGYGFNKAHSTRYAIVAYQTAYFKVHYPREFMAALLTFESGDTDKVVEYMDEARRMKVKIGAPDINTCGADFTAVDDGVRFGMAAVKGVGGRAVGSILDARTKVGKFQNLYHFCENVDLHAVNRATIEALIKCGAFDALGAHRAAMLAAVDQAIDLGNSLANDRRSGQMSFFGGGSVQSPREAPHFPNVDPLSESQLLQAEKDTLGFYITSHPLVAYGRELDALGSAKCGQLAAQGDGVPVTIGCMVSGVRTRITKSGRSAGQKMAIVTVEDLTGSCECVVFSENYEKLESMLVDEAILFISGTIDRRRETPQVIVNSAVPIEQAIGQLTAAVSIKLADAPTGDALQRLASLLTRHRGRCPISVEVAPRCRPELRAVIRAGNDWAIAPSQQFYKELCQLVGEGNVKLLAKPPAKNGNGRTFYGKSRFGSN